MVRLKDITSTINIARFVFQFHYGSIKGADVILKTMRLFKFQFHYGSIKGPGKRRSRICQRRFNSTMVRLKADRMQMIGCTKHQRFNSTMVRLKE